MTVSAQDAQGDLAPRERAALDILRERGGTATRAAIGAALDVSPATASRSLARLVDRGLIERAAQGFYRLGGDAGWSLPASAAAIVAALEGSGAEAHLTGLDLVAAHGHQFLRAYPHLVYADPDAIEQVAFALSQAGFQPAAPGRYLRNLLAHSPDVDRMVLLRGQSLARMARFGVRSAVAPPEKAWLDLLRETKAGNYPSSMGDLGAILASLLRTNFDAAQLRSWGREMGYEPFVAAVLDSGSEPDTPLLRELKAGAAR